MDFVHDFVSDQLRELWPTLPVDKSNIYSQLAVYYVILLVGSAFMYLAFAGLSFLIFFKWKYTTFQPAKPTSQQINVQAKYEIKIALSQIPFAALLYLPYPVLAHRGKSKLYNRVEEYGWAYLCFSIPVFLLTMDCIIYCVHRGLHHPLIYRYIHKMHHVHLWCTPFSSHAFHALDGFASGVPYYLAIFVMPMHHAVWLSLFVFVNFWTIIIHDQVDFGICNKYILTTGHHSHHHSGFKYNYGQYLVLWDKLGGSYLPGHQTHTLLGRRVSTAAALEGGAGARHSTRPRHTPVD